MVEVNEEIVCERLEEVKGFFVATDVKYRVKCGWSDIDIIAHNPKTDESWVVEVKGWRTYTIYPSSVKDIEGLSREAVEEIKKKLGDKPYKRILIIPKLSEKQKTRTIAMLEEKGFDEIFEFRNVLEQMIEKIDEHKNYDRSSTNSEAFENLQIKILRIN